MLHPFNKLLIQTSLEMSHTLVYDINLIFLIELITQNRSGWFLANYIFNRVEKDVSSC